MSGVVSLWGASSLIRSIQSGTITLTNLTSATATISAVSLPNSVLVYAGYTVNDTGNSDIGAVRLELTNGTTVTATRQTSSAFGCVVAYQVIEYAPGIVRVQRGTVSTSAATSATATIAAVNTARAYVSYLGLSTTLAAAGGGYPYFGRVDLTNSTTVTLNLGTATTSTASFEVVEWF